MDFELGRIFDECSLEQSSPSRKANSSSKPDPLDRTPVGFHHLKILHQKTPIALVPVAVHRFSPESTLEEKAGNGVNPKV